MRSRLAALTLAALLGLVSAPGCGASAPLASARRVTHRFELVGGERALGDVGDYLLENDKIRIVIQGPGPSRGFGVFGGSLLDADLRRPAETGTSGAGVGHDAFGELFPSFFIQAAAVDDVAVTSDGSDGGPARVEASGYAGDFLELVGVLNRAVTGSNGFFLDATSAPRLRYKTIYELSPGATWVTLRFVVENISGKRMLFPDPVAGDLLARLKLPIAGFTVPIGDVALFGATSEVFIPGAGFDVRFGLEAAYARKTDWPAFPGIVAPWVASRGEQVSYGLLAAESEHNYVYNKRSFYDDGKTPITKSSLLVPFVASSFLGVFHAEAPPALEADASFEVVKHFVVGNGDVGSVLDGIHVLRGTTTGTLSGQVLDRVTGAAAPGVEVLVYARNGAERKPLSQYRARANGFFTGTLEPGAYSLRLAGDGRPLSPYVDFSVRKGDVTSLRVTAESAARVVVNVFGEHGEKLPAKATAVGTSDPREAGKPTRTFLFDLAAGEPFRASDLVSDDAARPETRRFLEAVAATSDGQATLLVRPGRYEIVTSRGPEYDLARTIVDAQAGQTATVGHVLHRVVDTKGWIAADFHLHSRNSIDASLRIPDRVRFAAAEGLEWGVSADHNYVTDLAPAVEAAGLSPWLRTAVGLELTTLESGHFNGFPLRYEEGPVAHGAFAWSQKTPDELFSALSGQGKTGASLVQCNHPRDSIIGYFDQYGRSGLTFAQTPKSDLAQFVSPRGPAFFDGAGRTTFSTSFDLMEVANGKLLWEIHHFRVPPVLPKGDIPGPIPEAGTVLVDTAGSVAFPGAVDDWYNMLNLGLRPVGTGVSDSHEVSEESGYFRTMVFVGEDRVAGLEDATIVKGLLARRVVATNGPLVDFAIDGAPMGSTVTSSSKQVHLTGRLTAAPWMRVARLNVIRNGLLLKQLDVPARDLAKDPLVLDEKLDLAVDAAAAPIDSWFLLEAIGDESLFPVVRPLELPPLLLTDAVGSIAGPLGLGGSPFGALRPAHVFPIVAYAITNPLWVTTHAGAFRAPGLAPTASLVAKANDPGFHVTESGSIVANPARLVRPLDPRPYNPYDIRNLLAGLVHPH